jgi:hypothetical protein
VNVIRFALAWFQSHIRRNIGPNGTIAGAPVLEVPACALRLASGDQVRAVPQSAPPAGKGTVGSICPIPRGSPIVDPQLFESSSLRDDQGIEIGRWRSAAGAGRRNDHAVASSEPSLKIRNMGGVLMVGECLMGVSEASSAFWTITLRFRIVLRRFIERRPKLRSASPASRPACRPPGPSASEW